jgi:hypothetical protein
VSKAKTGMKLIKWLANQADDVAASADDLKRFGPQAARVRSLLDFIPTMSDDAARASGSAYNAVDDVAINAASNDAHYAVWNNVRNYADNAARDAARGAASNAGWDAVDGDTYDAARNALRYDAHYAADYAANATSVGDLIDPNTYRTLTNPLATGRAVDILGNRPRNQGLPFYDIVRQLGDSGVLKTPRDVVAASRLAKLPNNVRETALTILTDPNGTYTLQDLKGLLSSARLLA